MRFLVDNPISPNIASGLISGSIVVIEEHRIRIRRLPIGPRE